MYFFCAGDNSKHKIAKSVNKNIVATINHNKYEDVLLNKKCLRNSKNRIQNEDHRNRIGTYDINKISLS